MQVFYFRPVQQSLQQTIKSEIDPRRKLDAYLAFDIRDCFSNVEIKVVCSGSINIELIHPWSGIFVWNFISLGIGSDFRHSNCNFKTYHIRWIIRAITISICL